MGANGKSLEDITEYIVLHGKPKILRRTARKTEARAGYLFLAPLFILMAIFTFYSVYYVFKISFFKWDGVDPKLMQFISLRNYYWLFTDPIFYTAITNVLIFMVCTVLIQLAIGMIIAVLLRPKLVGHSFYKAIFYLPVTFSYVIIARIFVGIYEPNFGLLGMICRFLRLPVLDWLGNPKLALWAIIIANIFQWIGAQMVLYIAGLAAIPEEYFEQAQIDGAGFWKTLTSILFPLLNPVHTTVIILGIVGSIQTFDIVYLLTQGGPGTCTQFLGTYLYRTTITEFRAGYGAVIGVMMILISLGLSVMQNRIYQTSKNRVG